MPADFQDLDGPLRNRISVLTEIEWILIWTSQIFHPYPLCNSISTFLHPHFDWNQFCMNYNMLFSQNFDNFFFNFCYSVQSKEIFKRINLGRFSECSATVKQHTQSQCRIWLRGWELSVESPSSVVRLSACCSCCCWKISWIISNNV